MGKRLKKRLRAFDKRQAEYELTIAFLERGGHGMQTPKSGWRSAFRRPGSKNQRKARNG